MHADRVGKLILAVLAGEAPAPNGRAEFDLQGRRFHVATVRSRHFYGYALRCSLYIWVATGETMGLRLVYDDLDLSLDLPGVPAISEAIGMQIERCLVTGGASGFAWRLVGEITNILDADLQPPSPQQMTVATLIAKTLNVSLPGEALRYRGCMTEFLDRYQPVLDMRYPSVRQPGKPKR